jgi:RNA polymerase sigma-70 factor (ECF subfamily)
MSFWGRNHTSQSLQALSDECLCREAKNGCYEAYLILFDRYWRQVFRLAHAVLHDEGEAEDVAQALFLEVHRNMLQFDSERGSFRTLLLRYAYTRAIDQRRRLESRRFYSTIQLQDLPSNSLGPAEYLSSGLSIEEASRLIEQGMQQLDEKQSRTIEAYFFRGLSLNEIAVELNDSLGNVRHHLYRGIAKMRSFIIVPEPIKGITKVSAGRDRILESELGGNCTALPSEV